MTSCTLLLYSKMPGASVEMTPFIFVVAQNQQSWHRFLLLFCIRWSPSDRQWRTRIEPVVWWILEFDTRENGTVPSDCERMGNSTSGRLTKVLVLLQPCSLLSVIGEKYTLLLLVATLCTYFHISKDTMLMTSSKKICGRFILVSFLPTCCSHFFEFRAYCKVARVY